MCLAEPNRQIFHLIFQKTLKRCDQELNKLRQAILDIFMLM